MTRHLDKGIILYQQKNYAGAERELKLCVAEEPENPYARALLAGCYLLTARTEEALDEVELAIGMDPSQPFAHYMRSMIELHRGNLVEAMASIQEAIRQDPDDADFHALLSEIYFYNERFAEALEAAENALRLDPELVEAVNARAQVLVRLGRAEEAEQSLASALEREPANFLTHVNLGWVKLRQGTIKEAFEHFKEGLRLEPNSEWAREGVVEALKSRNPLYFPVLKVSLWLSGLDARLRFLVILLFYFFPNYAVPIVLVFIPVMFSDQLFNTMLRLDPYGRIVLTEEQTRSSNIFIAVLVGLFALAILACCKTFVLPS